MAFDKSKILKVIRGRKIVKYSDGSIVYLGKEGSDLIGKRTIVLVMKDVEEEQADEEEKESDEEENEHPFEKELKKRLE